MDLVSSLVGIVAWSINTTERISSKRIMYHSIGAFASEVKKADPEAWFLDLATQLFDFPTPSSSTSPPPPTPTLAPPLTFGSPVIVNDYWVSKLEVSGAAVRLKSEKSSRFPKLSTPRKSTNFRWLRLRPSDGIDVPLARVLSEEPGYCLGNWRGGHQAFDQSRVRNTVFHSTCEQLIGGQTRPVELENVCPT